MYYTEKKKDMVHKIKQNKKIIKPQNNIFDKLK